MKTYAYKTTKLTEHPDRTFSALSAIVGIDNLYDGQVIEDIPAFIEQLEFFSKYSDDKGIYVVEKTYREHGETGLHFYYWETILERIRWSDQYPTPEFLAKNYRMIIHYGKGIFFAFERKSPTTEETEVEK